MRFQIYVETYEVKTQYFSCVIVTARELKF